MTGYGSLAKLGRGPTKMSIFRRIPEEMIAVQNFDFSIDSIRFQRLSLPPVVVAATGKLVELAG